jgi:hypothetical protein
MRYYPRGCPRVDGPVVEFGGVNWRRTIGALLMILGCAAMGGMVAAAGFVVTNYVEWENSSDALQTVAMVTAPPMLGGAFIMLIGRWVYGGWSERAPIMGASSLAVRIAGFLVVGVLGLTLLFLIFTGIAPEDQPMVAVLVLGAAAGIALIFLGFRIRPRSNRRYLD